MADVAAAGFGSVATSVLARVDAEPGDISCAAHTR